MTITDIVNISRPLTEMAGLQPDTPAIIFPQEGRSLTFRELDQESDRVAPGSAAIGIGRGTRVALLVPPSRNCLPSPSPCSRPGPCRS